jgi:hypothetical protein
MEISIGVYALVSGVGTQEGLGHQVGAKRRPGAQERGNSDPIRKPVRRARGGTGLSRVCLPHRG